MSDTSPSQLGAADAEPRFSDEERLQGALASLQSDALVRHWFLPVVGDSEEAVTAVAGMFAEQFPNQCGLSPHNWQDLYHPTGDVFAIMAGRTAHIETTYLLPDMVELATNGHPLSGTFIIDNAVPELRALYNRDVEFVDVEFKVDEVNNWTGTRSHILFNWYGSTEPEGNSSLLRKETLEFGSLIVRDPATDSHQWMSSLLDQATKGTWFEATKRFDVEPELQEPYRYMIKTLVEAAQAERQAQQAEAAAQKVAEEARLLAFDRRTAIFSGRLVKAWWRDFIGGRHVPDSRDSEQ